MMEIALQGTLVTKRSKRSLSPGPITEGCLGGGMFEVGLEGWPGIQQEEKGRDGRPSWREMQLSSERMGSISGM